VLNWISIASNPNDEFLMEFYTNALPHSMAMWVKMAKKSTLIETFDQALKVEKEMSSLRTNPYYGENKYNHPSNKNEEIKLNMEQKENESLEIENL
jgi:hypothetical protein